MPKSVDEVPYGPVYVTNGPLKGRILYYDDDGENDKVICYAGHPLDFVGYYEVPIRYIREPLIDDLLKRSEIIRQTLTSLAIEGHWTIEPATLHALWSEKALIADILYERRMLGEIEHVAGEKTVFLCHSSSDKGIVRMVNDDLRRMGAKTWLDENNIKVGQSIVGKISAGLSSSQFLALFLSPLDKVFVDHARVGVVFVATAGWWQNYDPANLGRAM